MSMIYHVSVDLEFLPMEGELRDIEVAIREELEKVMEVTVGHIRIVDVEPE